MRGSVEDLATILLMKRLTVEDLERLALSLRQVDMPGEPLDLRLAMFILCHLISENWVVKNIAARPKGESSDPFGASVDSSERYKWETRVITFGEMIFHFQDVDGFECWLERLRTRPDVAAVISEIQGATLMYAAGFGVRFRNTEGRDLDVLLPTGDVAAETKCKVEGTVPAERTIRRTLRKACGQLLEDRAGFVLLNIPELWESTPGAMDTLIQTIKRFCQNTAGDTNRVTSIVIWWEKFIPENGGWWRVFPIKEERNPNAKHPAGPVRDIGALTNSADRPWTSLRDFSYVQPSNDGS